MNKLYLTVIALLSCFYMHSQVTIGLDEAPNKGALLDLKEKKIPVGDEVKGNSSKGLGLPRVELIGRYELTMGTNVIANESIAGGGTVWEAHTGLLVYNVKPVKYNPETCKTEGLPIGLHVWDGSAWQELGNKEGNKEEGNKDVRTVTDDGSKITLSYNGEVTEYRYSTFGAAGTWMTENLATKYLPDGTEIPKAGNSHTEPQYSIPNGEVTGKEGLLYNWPAAMNGYLCNSVDQGQQVAGSTTPGPLEVESLEESRPGAKDGKLQGICPAGWHVPSDREWNELEKEIATKASQYTQTPMDNVTWNDRWETETSQSRFAPYGTAMKSKTSIDVDPGGDSKPASSGGFDILLVGNGLGGSSYEYGKAAYLWSSSGSGRGDYAKYRNFEYNITGVNKGQLIRNRTASVRCKKD